ncbi:hypothetical protein GF323_01305 [Candidatus Woesearchaeota archaeon]|nr:hypothetical protein [Candidatus Woesearchaeota archaeon]
MKKTLLNLVISIFLISFVYAVGLGVAPAPVSFENALKGAATEKQISVQNPGENAITVSMEIEGETAEWIDFLPASTVEVPAKGQTKVTLRLTPPENEPNGRYTGKILTRAKGSSGFEGSGMGIFPGVDTELIATITDREIIRGSVANILTKDEEYGDPVRFLIGFTNEGNVPAGPDVRIEIKKGTGSTVDVIEKSLEKIQPGASREYKVEWETAGKEKNVYYRASAIVMVNGDIIGEKEDIGFRVMEKEEEEEPVKKQAEAGQTADNDPLVGMIIIITIVVLGAGIIILSGKKGKK